ncbi:MAG: hypothetical protein WA924_16330, partial [Burkholderiaceae bacterium]
PQAASSDSSAIIGTVDRKECGNRGMAAPDRESRLDDAHRRWLQHGQRRLRRISGQQAGSTRATADAARRHKGV